MSLRELLKDIHTEAENKPWAKLLMSGEMTAEQYGLYLNQQHIMYTALEDRAEEIGVLDDFPEMRRAEIIGFDKMGYSYPAKAMNTTRKYITYCKTMKYQQVFAHMYVRHFGDMFGGQMIKNKIPDPNFAEVGSNDAEWPKGTMYDFDDAPGTIKRFREYLRDDYADEARKCFQMAINLFTELEEYYDIQ